MTTTKTTPVPFSRLKAAEKRVALAKDVISQIKVENFKAQKGTYCKLSKTPDQIDNIKTTNIGVGMFEDYHQERKVELDKYIPQAKCTCCAKGALFLADVLRRDRFKMNGDDDLESAVHDKVIINRLDRIFPKSQLDLIEVAFEGRIIYWINYYGLLSNDILKKAKAFYRVRKAKKLTSDDILIDIMKNIIKNNGQFKP